MCNNQNVINELINLKKETNAVFDEFKKKDYDEILDLAMDLESKAYKIYDQLAPRVEDLEIRNVLLDLKEEEENHIDILETMMVSNPENFKIGQIKETNEKVTNNQDRCISEVLKHAIAIEKEGSELFKKLAKYSKNKEIKDLFVKLSRMEISHLNRLRSLDKKITLH